jgi:hypothetical protein
MFWCLLLGISKLKTGLKQRPNSEASKKDFSTMFGLRLKIELFSQRSKDLAVKLAKKFLCAGERLELILYQFLRIDI